MSDFFQNGVVTTLHRLGSQTVETLEARVTAHARQNPVALVLPCLVTELEGPAIGPIVRELARVPYLEEIVLALGRADRRQFEHARKFFEPLGARCRVLWIEGPRVQDLIRLLSDTDLDIGPQGKGRATWLSFGYVLAGERCRVIALHDCDIVTYNRGLVARLCYPMVDPSLGYEYTKGYYPRVTDRLHGRVTRLFVTPLVRALLQIAGPVPFLRYLDSFRYPLAGEFAMQADLARSVRIPGDWGLEVGMLAEVYRNTSVQRVCQVDIADNYDHKHQSLSAEDENSGLQRMARDIGRSILGTLAMEGVVFGAAFHTSLKMAYVRIAQDTLRSYHDDAAINGLAFDRHVESQAVEVFCQALARACESFDAEPLSQTGLPSWTRITSAIPDFLPRYHDAVNQDNGIR